MGWSSEAAQLASKKIRENSLKRTLGATCTCCPDCCFRRKWIFTVCIYAGIFLIAGIVILIYSVRELKTFEDSSKYKPTNCTTLSSNITGSLTCNSCSNKHANERNKQECQQKYPCLEMTVSLQDDSVLISETYLFEKWQTSYENTRCMVFEKNCGSNTSDILMDKVKSLEMRYGVPGSISNCYYNPEDPSQVVLWLYSISSVVYVGIGLGVFFLLLGPTLPLIVYLSCGCDYLWGCSPPKDIQDELMEKQQQQMAAQHQQQGSSQHYGGFTQDYGSGINTQKYNSPSDGSKGKNTFISAVTKPKFRSLWR